jgi:hypothetical protein
MVRVASRTGAAAALKEQGLRPGERDQPAADFRMVSGTIVKTIFNTNILPINPA